LRHPILYAEQFWLKQRLGVVFLLGVGAFMTIYTLTQGHGQIGSGSLVWLAYVPAGLLLYLALRFYRQRHQLRVGDKGITVGKLLSSVEIDYDRIRSVRVQPLRNHFQDSRSRMGRQPITRPLLDEPAVFFKFQGDPEEITRLHKQLGPRLDHDGIAAFPVKDPEAVVQHVSAHIPRATAQANLGGGKRRKRRR
jgi:hypothetical protein